MKHPIPFRTTPLVLAIAASLASPTWVQAAPGDPLGPEFRVNTFTSFEKRNPTVAMDADGNFVVAWESRGQDTYDEEYDLGIFAQRYNRAGVPQGPEFQVNTFIPEGQSDPAVAMDADGDFVVAWASYFQDGSYDGISARRYNRDGVPQGAEFRVNTFTTNDQRFPAVAMDTDGDFVVAWQSDGQDGSFYGIYARRYNHAGMAQGPEFRVNTYTTDEQFFPAVALDANGDFVVAWSSYGQDGGSDYYDSGVYAQRYNQAGVPQGTEFQVNTFTTNDQRLPTVAMDSDGDFVVAWESRYQDDPYDGIYAQRYAGASGGNTVAIDIKPGTSPNRINPGRNDHLPIAILGTSVFDTTQVDSATVRFGPDRARDIPDRRQFRDVNGDGDLDLVLRFQVLDTGLRCGDTEASLTGRTFTGGTFQGTDSLRTSGCQAVTIDIKPGSTPNRINPNRPDRLPVAILTTPTFDATQVNPRRVRFGPDRARDLPEHRRITDVDGDGDRDLVLRFRVLDTGIQCGDNQVSLTGVTFRGQAFIGSDTVRTVGCR